MTLFLKQSTAVVISFGPALDKTDGVTEETGLVSALDHASTGIKLSKNGGALTIRHATVTATTYDAYGMYRVTLDTTDTNTLGTLRMAFNEAATCLPVWQDFMVLPANIYDSIVSGSDLIDVSMTQILGTAVSSPATAGILDVNVKNIDNDAASASGTVTFPNATLASTTNITAAAGCAVSSIGANVITATSINADAITAAKIAAGAIDNATFAADVGSTAYATNIIALAADKAIANAALATAANLAALSNDLVSVATDASNAASDIGSVYARLGAPTGASVSADIAAVKAETATIQAKTTNLPAAPASTTNITAASGIAVSSIGANVITAASIAADAITDAKVASDVTIASVTGAVGSVTGAVGSVTGAVGSVTGNVGGNVVGSVGSVVGHTPQTGDSYARLGAPAGASVSADIAAVAADLGAVAADASNAASDSSAAYVRLGAPSGASVSADIAAVKAETATIQAKTTNLPATPADESTLTAMKGATFAGATDSLEAIRDRGDAAWATATGFSTLDAAGVRTAVGLASADLDAQLAALPTAAEIADANWDEALSGHLTAGTTGKALSDAGAAGTPLDAAGVRAAVGLATANLDTQLSNTYNRIGAPVFGNISGDIAANYAILTNIEDSVGVGMSVDVAAIKAKTDNLPADPASSTNVTAVYSRVGAPAGASVSADIAAVKAETATINTATGATAIRTAVGLATANLDTQLAAIDDLIDTEVGAIKTKTDYLPSATAGAAGGLFIAGANAATTVDITGNITGNLSGTVGSVTGAVGSVAANGITDTSIATDAINAAAVKADAVTKIQNGLATPTNITAAAGIALSAGERTTLANAILDLADGATTNYTLREALEVMLAVLAGKLSGAATATITIRDVNDTKNVVVATTTASGDRTAVTITP